MKSTLPPSPGTDDIQAIRGHSLELIDRLTEAASAYELPPPPDALQRYRRKL